MRLTNTLVKLKILQQKVIYTNRGKTFFQAKKNYELINIET